MENSLGLLLTQRFLTFRCVPCVKIKDTDDVLPVKEGRNSRDGNYSFEFSNSRPQDNHSPMLPPLSQRLRLPKTENLCYFLIAILMYTVAGHGPDPDHDPDPRGGGQLPNSTPTSGISGGTSLHL